MRVQDGLAAGLTLLATTAASPPALGWAFDEIATLVAVDFDNGPNFLDPDALPAIADDGTVVFADYINPDQLNLRSWNGGPGVTIDLDAQGFTDVHALQVRSAGDIALLARRLDAGITYQGVYRTTTAGGAIATILENPDTFDAMEPIPRPNVAMSENGTLAFSTIDDGDGSIYRGTIGGGVSVLRAGSGIFFNNQDLDVNDAGQVPVQMEYVDPTMGLARGILLFDAPGDDRSSIETAIEKTGVGVQPRPSINNLGQVAFSLTSNVTITFYDPPDDAGGTVVQTLNLTPGVYVSDPTVFGQPNLLTKIAGLEDGFESFGRVQINDDGLVVFQAGYDGETGVFIGNDPVADRILLTGEEVGSTVWSVVRLGELNNNNQFTLFTSQFGGDQMIWRVTIPEPTVAAMLAVMGVAGVGRRGRGSR